MIIGLGHRRQVGKNTIGNFVFELESHARITSFASALKDTCHRLFSQYGMESEMFYEVYPAKKNEPLSIGVTPREIMITLGHAVRNIYPATWVDLTLWNYTPDQLLVITDVRFPNEANAIKLLGGVLVRVDRADVSVSDDYADTALADYDDWDCVIANNGTLQDLKVQVAKLIGGKYDRKTNIAVRRCQNPGRSQNQ